VLWLVVRVGLGWLPNRLILELIFLSIGFRLFRLANARLCSLFFRLLLLFELGLGLDRFALFSLRFLFDFLFGLLGLLRLLNLLRLDDWLFYRDHRQLVLRLLFHLLRSIGRFRYCRLLVVKVFALPLINLHTSISLREVVVPRGKIDLVIAF
jgi:hypothetical protein